MFEEKQQEVVPVKAGKVSPGKLLDNRKENYNQVIKSKKRYKI
jgi:hypothetical protein